MMLDWLNNNQAVSAAEDSQVPDAPETPAPIFAYRALKGILFGSPDYDREDEDEDNKENVAPASPTQKLKAAVRNESRRGNVEFSASSSPLRSKSATSPNTHARERHHPRSPVPRK